MSNNCPCTIKETMVSSIKVVYLENELLRASILVGKGADVFELIYKPLQIDVLLKTNKGLAVFDNRNLSEQRLKMYSELYAGGWQDCLPHRARYEHIDITQETGGIAATLPWEYEITQNNAEAASILCFVQLPDIPLYIEKSFTLKRGDSHLYIGIRIRNQGSSAVKFTWTQHPAFGGQFLDENVTIEVPDCVAFHPRSYDRAFKDDLARFEEPIDRITLPSGNTRNIQEVMPKNSNEQFFIVLKNIREPWAKLINHKKGVGVLLKWQLDAFPYIRYWSNNVSTMYTIGIEPSNDAFSSFDDSLEHGTFRELQPNEEYATMLQCEIFDTERLKGAKVL
ncbi:DUF4432 family protein [Paenibacillus agricola]|uniref:DUF4432 family protein n=1 Tax=Paenibacillus agricola TaxID=2716264 RepID=A0ABX0J1Z2_9BACL|nr:DUF4432 family protein [Paenibacillus agricola]NHN29841.1 DUF4432 family protein [Paenibacillus agricola]